MWDDNDKNGFYSALGNNVGQISNSSFSEDITKYAANREFKTFLEIGTWNGLGSTKAFVEGFKSRNDDYIFYSLECNREKWLEASKLYQGNNKIKLLNEVIWNDEPNDFYNIFPVILNNNMYKHWNEVDLINMKQCPLFLERKDLPEIFDLILLDGGEFTTYHEFQILKNKCKILMLDDINVEKCSLIVKEITSDPKWKVIKTSNERNGYLIAARI